MVCQLSVRQSTARTYHHLLEQSSHDKAVPQVSILVQLLFNLYINDLPSVCETCKVESFVDDSKLYLSFCNKDTDKGLEDLRRDLLRVAACCCSNHLWINPDKTKFLVFGTYQMLSRTTVAPINYVPWKRTLDSRLGKRPRSRTGQSTLIQ